MLVRSRLGHWWSLGTGVVLVAGSVLVGLEIIRLYWVIGALGVWAAVGYFLDRVFFYSLAGTVHEVLLRDLLKASAWYRKAVDSGSSEPLTQARLGHYSLVEGDHVEAMRLLEEALMRAPRHVPARLDLALTYTKLGKQAEALEQAGRALAIRPSSYEAWAVLGMVRKLLGDLQGARVATARALELNDDLALAHSNMGEILYLLGVHEEAKRHLQRAVTLAPDVPDGHYWLGAIYLDENNIPRAREELVEALNRHIQQDYLSNVTRQMILEKLAQVSGPQSVRTKA